MQASVIDHELVCEETTMPDIKNATVIPAVPVATKYGMLAVQCAATASEISSTTSSTDSCCCDALNARALNFATMPACAPHPQRP